MDGKSALRLHSDRFELVEPFCASLFDEPKSFTQWCILSIEQALQQTHIDPTSQRVVFFISTTKGLFQMRVRLGFVPKSRRCV